VRGVELVALAGQRQQEAEEGLVAHPFALEPELAAVALDHVAHRQRLRRPPADGVDLPAHHRFGAHGLAAPDQVEVRARGLRRRCSRSCTLRMSYSSASRPAR
jgi:hypothetical protein